MPEITLDAEDAVEQMASSQCAGYRGKRTFDAVIAGVLFLVLLPLLALIALLVKLDGGPACISQACVGRHGREFRCWKFRTLHAGGVPWLRSRAADPEMQVAWDGAGESRRDTRLTWVGRLLRATSLEELPQIWNVLRGQMSLVGPRPVGRDELSNHPGAAHAWYVRAVPGVTGAWQVCGLNAQDRAARMQHDAAYIRQCSLRKDLTILGRTLAAVLRGETRS